MAEEGLEEVDLGSGSQELRPISISASLTEKKKSELMLLLKEFKDVFAWDYSEMPGLDPGLVAHTLNVDPKAKPVAQPARIFHTEIERQIVREVQKLLAAGFIKPIQHPRWLSNIVPVKKKNGQIRCCVDFKNLNKACPKDEFSLPNMDLLIDSAARSVIFSFMDGFNGYNQIRMAPKDAEKTAFKTPMGNFYYTIMPFGLKNAGTTYQRAMTAIFYDMMHQELGDYVDDIVFKLKKREEHFYVLKRVFERCRAFKLRMNPLKCAFGVSTGKFLGFLVHSIGIDVDPTKATTIVTMRPLVTVKELKSFLGKVSYIQRFIPRLASITSVFTKLLKKGQSFEWGKAQQTTIKRLQQILMNLPTVQALIHKKPLLLYLATNSYAICALIAQENKGGIEQPVYYISRALKDAETRYLMVERAFLAIVYASQRLRHYFLAYEVWPMTKSHAIKTLLQQPILSGRIS